MSSTQRLYYVLLTYSEPPRWWARGQPERAGFVLVEVGEDGLMKREVILDERMNPVKRHAIHGWTDMVKFDIEDLVLGRPPDGAVIISGDAFEACWKRAESAG